MPIVLEINGVPYENFESISVDRTIKTLAGKFSFTAAMTGFKDFPIKLQDRARVIVDGICAITGFVEEMELGYDDSSHSLRISGRDVTGDVVDSGLAGPFSILPASGSVTLKSAIEKILQINEINIPVIDNVRPKPFTVADSIDAEIGEGLFSVISKYAEKRQVLISTDGLGNIITARGAFATYKTKLFQINSFPGDEVEEGYVFPTETRQNNILSASSNYSTVNRFNRYLVESQMNLPGLVQTGALPPSTDIISQNGSAIDNQIRNTRQMSIPSDVSNSEETAESRAIWEANVRRAKSSPYRCVVQGFTPQNDPGMIWSPNFEVRIRDDKADLDGFGLIETVGMTFDGSGSKTTLTIVPPDSYRVVANQSRLSRRVNRFGADVF